MISFLYIYIVMSAYKSIGVFGTALFLILCFFQFFSHNVIIIYMYHYFTYEYIYNILLHHEPIRNICELIYKRPYMHANNRY